MSYIDDLISQANAAGNSHKIISDIYSLAFDYFLTQGVHESLIKDAAEAVAKSRRSELDLANLRKTLALMKALTEVRGKRKKTTTNVPILEYQGDYWVVDKSISGKDRYGFIWVEEVLFSGDELEYTENLQEVKISALETDFKPFNQLAKGVINEIKDKHRLRVKLHFLASQQLIVEVKNEDFDLKEVIDDNIDKLQDLDWEFDSWEFVNEDEGE